jgi:hypothetical protein
MEVGGKDFFDGREFVEPGEDGGNGVSIEEALVELLADFIGQAGDFAGGGGAGVVVMFWLRRIFVRRYVLNDNFVIHAGSLANTPATS